MGNSASSVVAGVSALWEAGVAGKAAAVVGGWQLMTLSDHVKDPQNFAVNVATVVVVYVVARRLAKTKIKDGTIKDLNDALAAKDHRVGELAAEARDRAQQVRQLEQAAHHCKTEAAKWEARYEEAKQYSAQPAVEQFQAELREHRGEVAERHTAMLGAMERMTGTLAVIEKRLTDGAST